MDLLRIFSVLKKVHAIVLSIIIAILLILSTLVLFLAGYHYLNDYALIGYLQVLQRAANVLIPSVLLALLLMLIQVIIIKILARKLNKNKTLHNPLLKTIGLIILSVVVWAAIGTTTEIFTPPTVTSSFPAGTYIVAKYTDLDIEKVQIGDIVMSNNINESKNEYASILSVITHEENKFIKINGELLVTKGHPFAVLENSVISWTASENLTIGDCLVGQKKLCVKINSVESVKTKTQTVYNVHVSDNENYFVKLGEHYVLVHNKSPVQPTY